MKLVNFVFDNGSFSIEVEDQDLEKNPNLLAEAFIQNKVTTIQFNSHTIILNPIKLTAICITDTEDTTLLQDEESDFEHKNIEEDLETENQIDLNESEIELKLDDNDQTDKNESKDQENNSKPSNEIIARIE